eukprot:5722474-Prymnesium_polylepis.1
MSCGDSATPTIKPAHAMRRSIETPGCLSEEKRRGATIASTRRVTAKMFAGWPRSGCRRRKRVQSGSETTRARRSGMARRTKVAPRRAQEHVRGVHLEGARPERLERVLDRHEGSTAGLRSGHRDRRTASGGHSEEQRNTHDDHDGADDAEAGVVERGRRTRVGTLMEGQLQRDIGRTADAEPRTRVHGARVDDSGLPDGGLPDGGLLPRRRRGGGSLVHHEAVATRQS